MVSRRRITVNSCCEFIELTLIPLLLPLFSLGSFLLLSSTSLESLDNIASDDVKLTAVIYMALFAAFLTCFSQLVTASITRTVHCGLRGRQVIAAASPRLLFRNALPLAVTLSSLPSLHLALRQTTVLLGSAAPSPYFMLPTIAVSLAVSFYAVYFELIRILSPAVTVTESTRYQLVTHSVFFFLGLSGGLLLMAIAGAAWFLYDKWLYLVVTVVFHCPSFTAVFLCKAAIYKMLSCHSRAAPRS